MDLAQRRPSASGNARTASRVISALAALVLVVAPAVDLAWNEPTLEEPQGARCPLHANPGAALGAPALVVSHSAVPLLHSEPVVHFELLSFSIFIPPRV